MINALSVDVEDWFHILDLENGYKVCDFDNLESRVEKNCQSMLRIFHEYKVNGTFFIIGWIAERWPDLVKEIHEQGHEIATHGYAHELCYEMSPKEFKVDMGRSIEILEELTGEKVIGARVAGASVIKESLWALDILLDLGIKYDSSIYPDVRGHGGLLGASRFPYYQVTPKGRQIFEIPSSCFEVFGRKIGFAGGGYLRLFPYSLIKKGINQYNRWGHPVNVYLHPREIDPCHPRMRMPLYRKFKCYVNLQATENKLRSLLKDYRFGRIKDIFNLA